jgi:nitric oxide reductase NorQ protein
MCTLEALADYLVTTEPFYQATGDEIALFELSYKQKLPMMLKGPTGCGKSRFVEYMAFRLGRPLVTVACHEDMVASDLIGRYLLDARGTFWQDGPLTLAARHGAICYLDELVEARQDTTVVIHPLTDSRRVLPLDKKGGILYAHPDFQLVMSYNPGYQGLSKEMKPSTRQRFVALVFDYPETAHEIKIICCETRLPEAIAHKLVSIAQQSRALTQRGLAEGVSTRMLSHAATLIQQGASVRASCELALVNPLSDDPEVLRAMRALVDAQLG